jgi:hypothetical protein
LSQNYLRFKFVFCLGVTSTTLAFVLIGRELDVPPKKNQDVKAENIKARMIRITIKPKQPSAILKKIFVGVERSL